MQRSPCLWNPLSESDQRLRSLLRVWRGCNLHAMTILSPKYPQAVTPAILDTTQLEQPWTGQAAATFTRVHGSMHFATLFISFLNILYSTYTIEDTIPLSRISWRFNL